MVDNAKDVRKNILDKVGMFAAFVTVVTYLVLCINAQWTFIAEESMLMKVLLVIRTYAPLVVVAITGIESVSKKNFLIRIIFYIAIALVVVFMFFPSTWNQFVGLINK